MTQQCGDDAANLFKDKIVTKNVKRKVLAEKKAHELVKQLLEENVDRNFFVNSVYFLSAQHYQDVNEERSILKKCGYPLCDKPLGKVPNQRYRIAGNRVYDLSQRKLFCSDRCYKASNHVAEQIMTSPLWLRDPDRFEPVDLDLSKTGSVGEEIRLHPRLSESDNDPESDKGSDSGDEFHSKQDKLESDENFSESHESISNSFEVRPDPKASTSGICFQPNPEPKRNKSEKRGSNPVDDVIRTLRQWLTQGTMRYLGLVTSPKLNSIEITGEELRKAKKLQQLERNLNSVVLGTSDASATEHHAMDAYTQRVEMFYRGRISDKEMVKFKEAEEKVNEKLSDFPTPVYPKIDSKNQTSIRRNILHQKLAKVCLDLFPGISPSTVSHDVKHLISTLNLTNTNVVLKTNEYPLMCILIVILLGKRNEEVRNFINQSETLIKHVLASYQLKLSTLQNKISRVIEDLISEI